MAKELSDAQIDGSEMVWTVSWNVNRGAWAGDRAGVFMMQPFADEAGARAWQKDLATEPVHNVIVSQGHLERGRFNKRGVDLRRW
jgi:hypothetical protein